MRYGGLAVRRQSRGSASTLEIALPGSPRSSSTSVQGKAFPLPSRTPGAVCYSSCQPCSDSPGTEAMSSTASPCFLLEFDGAKPQNCGTGTASAITSTVANAQVGRAYARSQGSSISSFKARGSPESIGPPLPQPTRPACAISLLE